MLTPEQARQARSALKLSQSAVAAQTGINRTYLSLFEGSKYAFDDDTQDTLRSFYEDQGHTFDDSVTGDHEPTPELASEKPTAHEPDARVRNAVAALQGLKVTAETTGADSKRTATTVASVRASLMQLDYPELVGIAQHSGTTIEGFPTEEEFRALALDDKQEWETRAACALICACLYGEHWNERDCKAWSAVVRNLATEKLIDSDECPRRPLFGGNKSETDYVRRVRTFLAPAIVTAAEQRRAPTIVVPAMDSWGFFS